MIPRGSRVVRSVFHRRSLVSCCVSSNVEHTTYLRSPFHGINRQGIPCRIKLIYPLSYVRSISTDPLNEFNILTKPPKYVTKELVLRGKAATTYQESFLEEFVNSRTEASFDDWQKLIDQILDLKFGMITATNIDGKILDACEYPKNLSLARSYINFMKHSGKKFNGASVCHFLRVCYKCKSSLTDEDKTRIQQFTKFLLSKYTVMDPLIGDGTVKGLILCGLGDKCLLVIKNLEEINSILVTTYSAYATYLVEKEDSNGALDIVCRIFAKNALPDDIFFLTWLNVFKSNRFMLDKLLEFLGQFDFKLSKLLCDHIIDTYNRLPQQHRLEGHYGTITNAGVCQVCQQSLNRSELSEKEFEYLRKVFLERSLIGDDIFKNTTVEELERFRSIVTANAPFDVVIDGLNVAYMPGLHCGVEVSTNLILSVVRYFQEQGNKCFVIGRKHMKPWPKLIQTIEEYNANYFLIDNVNEDDPYLVFSALYSGIDSLFVTRDLLRQEKFALGNTKQRHLFKRWQQSHQVFITYVAPSGRVYCKTPIQFEMTTQRTKRNGWHIPYVDELYTQSSADDYGIHRRWVCLDSFFL